MISKEHVQENLLEIAKRGIPLLAIAYLALNASFSKETKNAIKEKQKNICAHTGCNRPAVEVHHIVQKSKGGSGHFHNGVALCKSHHRHWDKKARKGIIFRDISIDQAPPTCFERDRNGNRSSRRNGNGSNGHGSNGSGHRKNGNGSRENGGNRGFFTKKKKKGNGNGRRR